MNQINYDAKSSTVCIDATEVKRIREGKQLTQFYVSKVVGVTTDTISRWENNRYPTIRRENALKLAEALEVPLADILLKPAEESIPGELPAQKSVTSSLVHNCGLDPGGCFCPLLFFCQVAVAACICDG